MTHMKSKLSAGLVLLALPLGIAACGGTSDASGGDGSGGSIDLVAYSTPQTAYEEDIIPAFNKTEDGAGVDVSAISGTGPHGRVVKRDVETAVAGGGLKPAAAAAPSAAAPAPAAAPLAKGPSDEAVLKNFAEGS